MNVGYPTLEGASIPGDPEGLDAIASRLQAAQDDVSTVQGRIAVDGAIAGWEGQAADRFRSSLEKLPGELTTVANAFEAASGSIRSFSGQLTDFQNNAHYYANRAKNLEEELHSSQRRHDEVQAEVDAARFRESAASDPISLKTAVEAVKDGLGKLQLALDGVEANRGELERVRREAQTNREDYEQAVRACCTELQDAAESTTHSNGAPHIAIGALVAGVVSTLLHEIRDHTPADNTPTTTKSAPISKTQKPPVTKATPPPAGAAPPAAQSTAAINAASIAAVGTSDVGPVPVTGTAEQISFAESVLAGIGAPQSASNVAALVQWQHAEGGPVDNPLNTTRGQGDAQGSEIQGYGTVTAGAAETVATLENGYYPAILSALRASVSISAVRQAIIASPWDGSSHYAGTDYAAS